LRGFSFERIDQRCKNSYIKRNRTPSQNFLQVGSDAFNIPNEARFSNSLGKAKRKMRTTSPRLDTSHLTAHERAIFRCQAALELKDKGDYAGVQEVMRPLWKRVGERPNIEGLHPSVSAEVLLCVGILTGWIGSKNQIEEAQEAAKNLITESIVSYESVGDIKKIAVARAELAYCYWREGALEEARIMFRDALGKLTTQGNTRARALLRLAILEWSASRFNDSLSILGDNAALFKKITNHSIKGAYHSQFAMVLRELATAENRKAYLQRAIREYEEADRDFKLAQNIIFRADVKNNVGNVLCELSRFKEAHVHLDQARRLSTSVKDKVQTAQIDDTRARVLRAEGRLKESESVARCSVSVLEKSGRKCLLAEGLTTYGITLARLKHVDRAQFTLQRAIEVAHQVGAVNKAGLAALTMIEELDNLSPEMLGAAYEHASEWLAKSQSQAVLLRLNVAARKVLAGLQGGLKSDQSGGLLSNNRCDLQQEVLKYESALISQALAKVNGSVTHAAALLGMSYQGLAYIIESRHKNLLKERTPVRRRSRK
jgi:tetratricopeptide (TPR) repeat protein